VSQRNPLPFYESKRSEVEVGFEGSDTTVLDLGFHKSVSTVSCEVSAGDQKELVDSMRRSMSKMRPTLGFGFKTKGMMKFIN
jgi:hypothetical protein